MANTKISALAADTAPTADDLVVTVNDPAGTPATKKATITNFTKAIPAVVGDSGSGGTKGLVPAPGAGDAAAGKFLKADGTFAVPSGTGAEVGANSDITSMDGLTGALENPTKIVFPEAAAPSTPAANKVVLYAKSDGLLYSKDDAGAESAVSGGAGGSPGGSDGHVQYNNAGAFGGSSNFSWNNGAQRLTFGAGSEIAGSPQAAFGPTGFTGNVSFASGFTVTFSGVDIAFKDGSITNSYYFAAGAGALRAAANKCYEWTNTTNNANGGSIDTALGRNAAGVVEVNSGTPGTLRDLKVRQHYVDQTITAGGTTGAQTINKSAGTVNIAATGTSVVVTCDKCTTSSLVFAVIRTNDSTATIKNVVPGSGSFTINLTAAATAEVSIGFLVVNQ